MATTGAVIGGVPVNAAAGLSSGARYIVENMRAFGVTAYYVEAAAAPFTSIDGERPQFFKTLEPGGVMGMEVGANGFWFWCQNGTTRLAIDEEA